MTASSGIVILVLEVTAIKLAFYLLQGSRATFLDLLSCSGYKFLCFVLTMIFRWSASFPGCSPPPSSPAPDPPPPSHVPIASSRHAAAHSSAAQPNAAHVLCSLAHALSMSFNNLFLNLIHRFQVGYGLDCGLRCHDHFVRVHWYVYGQDSASVFC